MEPNSLRNFYTDLKKSINPSDVVPNTYTIKRDMNGDMGADTLAWRNKAVKNCSKLKDDCRKHIIVDIYAKIIPLDDDYCDKNKGMLCKDIDCMLTKKNMTPTQYLTSCSESTKAPFVNYLIWATDKIGEQYMREAEEKLKDAQKNEDEIPEPPDPDVNDQEVQNSLVDVKSDTEYDTFVDTLKKKTIDKIVADISEIIADKKDETDMTFDTSEQPPATEEEPVEGEEPAPEEVPEPEGEPKKESADIVFESAMDSFNEFTGSTNNVLKDVSRKLVSLNKSIRTETYKNIVKEIKEVNKARPVTSKIPPLRKVTVMYKYNGNVVASGKPGINMKSRQAAKDFIKALAKEYKKNQSKAYSTSCTLYINILLSTTPSSATSSDALKVIQRGVEKGLESYTRSNAIKLSKRGHVVSGSDGSTYYQFPITIGMKYLFGELDAHGLEQLCESVSEVVPVSSFTKDTSVGVPFDYLTYKNWGKPMTENATDELLGLAIREATLHELDLVFKQPESDFNKYKSNIRYGKGYVVNESTELNF